MKKLLNFEYATIHGTYWMFYGVICSFASVFLLARGYSNSEIGIILAAGNVLAVFLQPFTADLADRSKRFTIIGISQIMTIMLIVMTGALLILEKKTMALFIIYVLIVAWLTVLQPLFNSLSFRLEECGVHINFGMGRSMGSLAYSIMCALLGTITEKNGVHILPISGEIILIMLLISLFLTKKTFNNAKEKKHVSAKASQVELPKEDINLIDFIKGHKVFFMVNVGVLGVFFSNAILNNFMIQIVSNVGGNSQDMGRIFSVMAFLEIPTLFCFDALRKKFSCQLMLKVAAIAFALKIGICFIAKSVLMIFVAQFLQLFSFALFLPAMVHFIDEIMNRGEAVKGQALFTMMNTITTVFASFIGGIILDAGGATVLTLIATIVTTIGGIIIVASVDKAK